MRTLLQLTDTAPPTDDDEVFGPEVILACMSLPALLAY